jgi:hypothetical protein
VTVGEGSLFCGGAGVEDVGVGAEDGEGEEDEDEEELEEDTLVLELELCGRPAESERTEVGEGCWDELGLGD